MTARRKLEWFDDESIWRDLYPIMFQATRFADAIRSTGRVLRLAGPKGKDVLDLCCGPGRFSIALAKRGYRVTGVDRTRFLLNKARARAKAERARVEWVTQDMRDFVRPDAFDLALSMFTSFGYFDDKQEDVRVLENIHTSLRPGGVVLLEMGGKEWIAQHYASVKMEMLPGGARLVQRHAVLDDWTRLHNEWILIRRGRTKTFRFDLTIYSGQELRDRLERAGFVDVALYGGLDGREYGLRAERLVAVGRKAGPRRRAR
jgi:SAM-dependent methyltransferase